MRKRLANKMFLYELVPLFSKKNAGGLVADFRRDTEANLRVISMDSRVPYHYNERRKTLNLPSVALESTSLKHIGVALQKAAVALYQRRMPIFAYRVVSFVDIHTHLLLYHGTIAAAAVFLIWAWLGYGWLVLFSIYCSFYWMVILAALVKVLYDMKASAEALHWLEGKRCTTQRELFMVREVMYAHLLDHLSVSMGSVALVLLEYVSMIFSGKKLTLR